MATTAQHLEARADIDLRQRLMAAAEQAEIADAEAWVAKNIGALLTAPIASGTTIVDVHAYASNLYEQAIEALPKRPGVDPAAVTDAHLAAAVADVLGSTS